jgi:hypothetical protein
MSVAGHASSFASCCPTRLRGITIQHHPHHIISIRIIICNRNARPERREAGRHWTVVGDLAAQLSPKLRTFDPVRYVAGTPPVLHEPPPPPHFRRHASASPPLRFGGRTVGTSLLPPFQKEARYGLPHPASGRQHPRTANAVGARLMSSSVPYPPTVLVRRYFGRSLVKAPRQDGTTSACVASCLWIRIGRPVR